MGACVRERESVCVFVRACKRIRSETSRSSHREERIDRQTESDRQTDRDKWSKLEKNPVIFRLALLCFLEQNNRHSVGGVHFTSAHKSLSSWL